MVGFILYSAFSNLAHLRGLFCFFKESILWWVSWMLMVRDFMGICKFLKQDVRQVCSLQSCFSFDWERWCGILIFSVFTLFVLAWLHVICLKLFECPHITSKFKFSCFQCWNLLQFQIHLTNVKYQNSSMINGLHYRNCKLCLAGNEGLLWFESNILLFVCFLIFS